MSEPREAENVMGLTRPFEFTAGWLLAMGLFGMVTVVGVLAGRTNEAMCAFIFTHGAIQLVRAAKLANWLEEEGQHCAADLIALADENRPVLTGFSSTLLQRLVLATADTYRRHRQTGHGPHLFAIQTDLECFRDRLYAEAEVLQAQGLMGTLVGLTLAFSEFKGVLQTGSTEALGQGIQQAITGLATAFVTTIFSTAFGSLLLKRIADGIGESISRLMSQVSSQFQFVLARIPEAAAELDSEDDRRAA